jgi:hypothetical protein
MTKLPLLFLLILSLPAYSIKVSENTYEGSSHYVITTRTATYWYDMQGGGISRMIDRHGNDWVAFRREPWNKNPASSASSYRGIPNLVFQGDDDGCGHPGWDKCESIFEAPDIIRTRSKSGKWEWTWTFYEDKALMEVLKADPTRSYWFLYEGPSGGKFKPENSYWRNSSSPLILRDVPDHIKGQRVTGNWQWVMFGKDGLKSRLFIIHKTPDNETDSFSYMGSTGEGIRSSDGMTVFGFGRTADSKPVLSGNHKFVMGFGYRKNIKIRNEF